MSKLGIATQCVADGSNRASHHFFARLGRQQPPLRIGQIGCGRIAQSHDMPGVIKSDLADYVAICELDAKRARRRCEDHREGLRRARREAAEDPHVTTTTVSSSRASDIDAVVISTPDHWHAEVALAAVESGKDVYLQKPFTMTHAEGVILRDAVKRHGRILQVGSQQRSWEQFRRAAELIRSGRIGHVQRVEIGLPTDPTAPDAAPEAVPANLDFSQWLGPDAVRVLHRDARASARGLHAARAGCVTRRIAWA